MIERSLWGCKNVGEKFKIAILVVFILLLFSSLIAPVSANSWVDYGYSRLDHGKYQDALDAFNKAIEIDPTDANAWRGKGLALVDLGRCQEALDALDKAVELNLDDIDTLAHRGDALDCVGRHQEAVAIAEEVIDMCDELIALNPNDFIAWHVKGWKLYSLEKYDEAIIAYSKALELDNTNPHSWCGKGDAFFVLGRYQEAVDAYENATKLNPNLAHFWLNKGKALDALGKYEEANEAYNKALELSANTSTPTPTITAAPTTAPTAEPTAATTPASISSASTSMLPSYIIGGVAVILILLLAGIGLSHTKKKGDKKPKPPTEPPKPEPEPIKPEPISGLTPPETVPIIKATTVKNVDISSAFGHKGATILFKIKMENPTAQPVSDLKIHLFVPEVFLLKEHEKYIGLLKRGESKTVTFEIRPTGECGDCEVSGRVTYYDYASQKTKEVDIPPKTLSIVCPLLKAKKIDEETWRAVTSELAKTEESTKEIEMPAKTLFEVASDILKDMNMFMLPASVTDTPQLFRATARFYAEGVKELKYAAQLEVVGGAKKSKLIVKAWAEKEEALTGFYHGILDELEKRIQVKGYIEDSIVQHFYQIGTVVKDSVVQRSTIGAGVGAGKTCPNCGRAVSEAEKYCPECGQELK